MTSASVRVLVVLALALVCSAFVPSISAHGAPPAPPAWVRGVEVGGGAVALSWSPSLEESPRSGVHFRVYRSVDGGSFGLLAETQAAAFVDLDPADSGETVYAVTVVTVDGIEGRARLYVSPADTGGEQSGACVRASSHAVGVYPDDCIA